MLIIPLDHLETMLNQIKSMLIILKFDFK